MAGSTNRSNNSSYKWKFCRLGGFDQVRIETGADILALEHLDQKLWAALSCPTHGLEFDVKTLELIDSDGDGRIRVPEMLNRCTGRASPVGHRRQSRGRHAPSLFSQADPCKPGQARKPRHRPGRHPRHSQDLLQDKIQRRRDHSLGIRRRRRDKAGNRGHHQLSRTRAGSWRSAGHFPGKTGPVFHPFRHFPSGGKRRKMMAAAYSPSVKPPMPPRQSS